MDQDFPRDWICPNCNTHMKDLELLIEDWGGNSQGWPVVYWCPKCGTFVGRDDRGKQVYVPKNVYAKRIIKMWRNVFPIR